MAINDKKPGILAQARASAKANAAPTTATERMDKAKSKQLLDVAAGESRMRPDSKTLNRGMITAIAVDEAYKSYREAITALRASMDGKNTIKDDKKRYDELRALKTQVDEDVAADPNKVYPSVGKLNALAEALVTESKRMKRP